MNRLNIPEETKTTFKFWKQISLFSIAVLVITFVGLSFNLPYDSQAQTDLEKKKIENRYAEKKSKLSGNLTSINNGLGELKDTIGDTVSQKNSYLEEKKSVEEDIKKGENLIVQTKLAIAQLDEELAQKQNDIDERKLRVAAILQQMQAESESSSVEVFFSGRNFGDIISGLTNVSSLQDKLIESTQSLNQAKKDQEEVKTQYEQTKRDQEETQQLLALF